MDAAKINELVERIAKGETKISDAEIVTQDLEEKPF